MAQTEGAMAESHVGLQWAEVKPGRFVATVTVDNQAKLNTMNSKSLDALADTIDALDQRAGLVAMVLTGAGDRAFIGGASIDEMAGLDGPSARAFIGRIHRCCDSLRSLPVPVIARIKGYALGAGLEIAAACDIRVAAVGAVFGMPEVKVGIPSVVEAALLPSLIGWGRTREMLLFGETVDAERAAAWGLVERLVPADQLDAAIDHYVTALLAAGPEAVRSQKRLIRAWEDLPVSQAVAIGIDAFAQSWGTDEPRERMAAFLAGKRTKR
jgi:enoyl-CoA hydratase